MEHSVPLWAFCQPIDVDTNCCRMYVSKECVAISVRPSCWARSTHLMMRGTLPSYAGIDNSMLTDYWLFDMCSGVTDSDTLLPNVFFSDTFSCLTFLPSIHQLKYLDRFRINCFVAPMSKSSGTSIFLFCANENSRGKKERETASYSKCTFMLLRGLSRK
jgi:hypothetical protein